MKQENKIPGKKIFDGFKEFIMRGNVVDLAVAVIMAGAFSPIVKAVTNLIMNMIGAIFGAPSFDTLGQFKLNGATIQPGTILTAAVNFLMVAAAVYFFVIIPLKKAADLKSKEDNTVEAEEVLPSEEVQLLREIRDALNNQNKQP